MGFRSILHPTDFSEVSQTALRYAAELAHDYGAKLFLLHAVETLGPENVTYGEAISRPQPDSYRQRLRDDLRRIQVPYADTSVEYLISEDDPVKAILRTAAERSCDLIVMGSHGRHGMQRLLEGSVAEHVVRGATCPVLVVKAPIKTGELARKLHPENTASDKSC